MLQSYRRRQGRAGNVTPYARAGHMSSRMGGAVETYKRLTSAAAQLTAGLKSRGIYPKSTLQRKLGGSRVGRKLPATRVRSAPAEAGGYSQMASTTISTGRKPRTTLARLARELHSKNETTIIRYSGMNNFNDNGFYWCGKNRLTVAGRTDLPLYMFDLTSTYNTGTGGITVVTNPMYRANVVAATGVIGWTGGSTQGEDGTSLIANWFHEKFPSTASSLSTPHEKSRLLWTDCRLNLWGAKAKAIKYTVQVVKLLDDTLDPMYVTDTLTGPGYAKHCAFWQGMIKPYTYNPLALTSVGQMRGLKVLKTYETIIQPTSSTETDVDPHVKVLKWFMRWDREINYKETASRIGTATDLTEQADFKVQSVTCLPYTKPKAKIWLMIRASAYAEQVDSVVDNTVSPSFDMTIRASHINQ